MVLLALVWGHSFVRRLGDYESTSSNNFHNFNFDGNVIQISCSGLGGGTVLPGPKSLQLPSDIYTSFPADIVFIQAGGNDLSKPRCDPDVLAQAIFNLACSVSNVPSVRIVIVGQLLPRFNDDGVYNAKLTTVNTSLASMLNDKANMVWWKHRGFWQNPQELYSNDNVHLNRKGMTKYARSVRSAIGSQLKRFP
ncbi:uncharacterized protein [Argopecten irradians]|uniref:uncharacterized protein n=1 Tax=Argopecten irradians TaxID=31199 RepID=UPI003710A21F